MSKAVLISILPKWCELIASGEKTIEVRKTRPRQETPFKSYIYCTKFHPGDPDSMINLKGRTSFFMPKGGAVIGEFVCDEIIKDERGEYADIFEKRGLLTLADQIAYGKNKPLYGWFISELLIYDVPKKLSEFTGLRKTKFGYAPYEIIRQPQSWCYVKELP